jgi:ubiquinone/menaquinone biosynthesis C-methylase UbiE/DNA-binding transcriptional ArsR family regulator
MSSNTALKSSEVARSEASDKQLTALTGLCKASADTLRLLILRVLRKDSFGVSELCTIFAIRQPALSHHLKVLANAGLIAARREGNNSFYRRAELGQHPDLETLHHAIFETVDGIELPEDIKSRLSVLNELREENSRNFFRDNAHKFQQQQDLIASYEQYAEVVAKVLSDAPIAEHGTVLEVGPGDGSFLLKLSPMFDQVVALDNAPGMLKQAKTRVQAANLSNVEFVAGDSSHVRLTKLQTDCVVMNMVLHHTPAPGSVLKDVASTLAPAGVVLVTDLCNHDQGWARENCGDLWLGFDPQELAKWAMEAGLTDIASVYLAQRNGFQIQVRLFGRA